MFTMLDSSAVLVKLSGKYGYRVRDSRESGSQISLSSPFPLHLYPEMSTPTYPIQTDFAPLKNDMILRAAKGTLFLFLACFRFRSRGLTFELA
jgi:hypothetical protein